MKNLSFLFLQGLPSPFFSLIGNKLSGLGCKVMAINLCLGDQLFWRGQNPVNYRGTLAKWPAFIEDFLDRNHITDIVLVGEQRSYHKIAIAAAKQRGIRVTVSDFGYLRPDWITFEKDGMNGCSLFPKDPVEIRQLASGLPPAELAQIYQDSFWTMAVADMVYHFGNYFFWWLYPGYRRPYRRDHPLLHYLSIGWRILFAGANNRMAEQRLAELKASGARFFVFPMQLEHDFQIVSYSPFTRLEDAISLIENSFAQHAPAHMRLLVKLHPLEPGLKNWRKIVFRKARELGIGNRVDFIDGGRLGDIITHSEGMITINSTAGINALMLGRPVKTLGAAIYDIAGLTCQGSIDSFWTTATPPDPKLVEAFLKVLAASVQIRGVFYNDPGLHNSVEQAVGRLFNQTVNCLITRK